MVESNWFLNGYKIEWDVTKIVGDVDDGDVGCEMLIKNFRIQIQILKFQFGTSPTLQVCICNRKLICCLFVVLIAVNNARHNACVCLYACMYVSDSVKQRPSCKLIASTWSGNLWPCL
jgi:hypothetical protein